MSRAIGSSVWHAQHGTGKVIDACEYDYGDHIHQTYEVEFSSGHKQECSPGELFDSYQDFEERNAEDYHR